MMSEIYSSARYVQAWLGLETEDTEARWVIDGERMWNELANLHQRGYAEVTDGWLSAVDVEDHVKRGMLKLEEVISQEEIMDKGKADWVVKCMLGFQVLWLSTQCVARAFNISPSPRWRSALSHTSHLCSSLCRFGGISHTTSMSQPSSMDNLGSVALRSSLRILPNRIFQRFSLRRTDRSLSCGNVSGLSRVAARIRLTQFGGWLAAFYSSW
jgi:hypothetical protein